MESLDYWRLCDQLSVIQAALLVWIKTHLAKQIMSRKGLGKTADRL